ncbi:hypothetical protein [Streptomyces avermitilis]|uniref:hypothetical protein n=1 Tax=Streptomyces avermitilis TaxID=33903 RepID=UPI0036BC9560
MNDGHGDTSGFRAVGENAAGLSGAAFATGPGSTVPHGSKGSRVTARTVGQNGPGTFTHR